MFEVKQMHMKGLMLLIPKVFGDERGFFMETFKRSELKALGVDREFLQDNHSRSVKGVLRGLHYQVGEHAQAKLVRCINGLIFDVAVDIRPGSETFGQWYGIILSEENHYQLFIPEGFAHGYYTISETAEVIYKTTREYAPNADRGIIWNDPDIGIYWPSFNPVLSEKDTKHPILREIKEF
ncbi:MAG TPA: dTDP-4-dehydrorhamnose 3,5-epimerase [Candidatus Cloacimonadota bacterium]|nr:dTDP-4-dehydrorhamnose 3,5-epimerase [Candidatus Cloacimonadota bacterium]HPM02186.1 dTDP-4-dehydrorhamnose 3,5-epimerase [Candidatus Cloacimonadota bacterium]